MKTKIILQSEFQKFIKKFNEQYPEFNLGCKGLPYHPQVLEVDLIATNPAPPIISDSGEISEPSDRNSTSLG